MTDTALPRSRGGERHGEAHETAGRATRPATRRRGGFTLIETALATIIVGVGILAVVAAQSAFHQKNNFSTHVSTATYLANEIRELSWNLPREDPVMGDLNWGAEVNEIDFTQWDDIDDFDFDGGGSMFTADTFYLDADPPNGPINAQASVIPNMDGWTQIVQVVNIDPYEISDADGLAPFGSNMVRVEVTVQYRAPTEATPREMIRVWWIAPH